MGCDIKVDFINIVKDTIKRYNMIEKGDGVLIGCSGGVDSMVLLDCMYKLKDEYDIKIVVAHVNHMLRSDADDDEKFVVDACKRYGLKCITKKIDVKKIKQKYKLSEEESGRIARYNFFYELLKQLNLNKILLGHNKNDLVETFFLNLFRGSGLDGLCSIPPKRDIISRPLIFISRKEIEEYAQKNNIEYVFDKTNLSDKYKRNIVRNTLIPLIEKNFNIDLVNTISKTIEIIRDENQVLKKIADEAFYSCVCHEDDSYILDINTFMSKDNFIQKRILKDVFKRMGYIPSYENLSRVYTLFSLQSGKRITFDDIIVEKQQDEKLVFYKKDQKENFCFEIPLKEEYYIRYKDMFFEFKYVQNIDDDNALYIDADRICGTPFLRNRRDGDYIHLKVGRKKLKRLFIDNKIPLRYRDKIPLIAVNNEVIALFNIYQNRYLMNERYKAQKDTKRIIKVRLSITRGVEELE